ncbi:MAG: hypothetical protein HKO53_09190, partial [Gemmatimonadetes bacterium]|nr:hypothetical protein [Gemmatimonadota bacterium]
MDSLKGQLLISSGGLFDPNFRHTVVLVGAHGPEGALGVILNRMLDVTVQEAIPDLAPLVGGEAHLFEGGPVQPHEPVLLAEMTDPGLADLLVFDAVGFLVGDVAAEMKAGILRARLFAGHAGWGPGQ